MCARAQLREQLEDDDEVERLRAMAHYATSPPGGAPFPPPPPPPGPYRGALLENWLEAEQSDVVMVP